MANPLEILVMLQPGCAVCRSRRKAVLRFVLFDDLFELAECRVACQFLAVALFKLLPFGRVVVEPLAEFVAGRHLFEPQVGL